ncbi:MAG: rhomboid family intramembrane serine protease [Candidatus Thermoplasmatota archaeon]|nr:rhomboid family intramembrane serine protease [Candidatus Thermoplasmatota archaeon]|tara:strand:- start:1655 stop:2347 length:693 start_codon:yes stop_codon:yes gene_type:complete
MKRKPLFPFVFPLCDSKGKFLRPNALIKSRGFSFSYLLIVMLIWYFLGFGHWGGRVCESFIQQLSCSSAIWPNKLFSKPHEYIFSFFTSPYFHNDPPHLKLVIYGFLIFAQSFEARSSPKSAMLLFFLSITFTCLLIGLIMNIGHYLDPDSALFNGALDRSFMGGSVGMFGLLGGLSHYSRKKWLIPSIVVMFEIWNRYFNGMNIYITMGHLTSFFFGFILWSYWLKYEN